MRDARLQSIEVVRRFGWLRNRATWLGMGRAKPLAEAERRQCSARSRPVMLTQQATPQQALQPAMRPASLRETQLQLPRPAKHRLQERAMPQDFLQEQETLDPPPVNACLNWKDPAPSASGREGQDD